MSYKQFVVNKAQLKECALVVENLNEQLNANQLLLKVDKFAFTANNISYAVAGDLIGYWKFFPTEEGKGVIPVWGFADVVKSTREDITEGTRLYGYFPMAEYLTVEAGALKHGKFKDVAAHRASLPSIYNQYEIVPSEGELKALEDQRMLLLPLFGTSFLLQDMLDMNDFFGADTVIIGSASSKTGLGLAKFLKLYSDEKVKVLGLTSQQNKTFVESLGCYDLVLLYEEITTIDLNLQYVFVDMAGNPKVTSALHNHLQHQLKASYIVGTTHWDAGQNSAPTALSGPQPQFFFAPSHIQQRVKDWGAEAFNKRFFESWLNLAKSADWLEVNTISGIENFADAYLQVLGGSLEARQGLVFSPGN